MYMLSKVFGVFRHTFRECYGLRNTFGMHVSMFSDTKSTTILGNFPVYVADNGSFCNILALV